MKAISLDDSLCPNYEIFRFTGKFNDIIYGLQCNFY